MGYKSLIRTANILNYKQNLLNEKQQSDLFKSIYKKQTLKVRNYSGAPF
jgi:hypothetical protein